MKEVGKKTEECVCVYVCVGGRGIHFPEGRGQKYLQWRGRRYAYIFMQESKAKISCTCFTRPLTQSNHPIQLPDSRQATWAREREVVCDSSQHRILSPLQCPLCGCEETEPSKLGALRSKRGSDWRRCLRRPCWDGRPSPGGRQRHH